MRMLLRMTSRRYLVVLKKVAITLERESIETSEEA